ncbi:MAG: hypothetical protein MR600_00530, partial [Subdoligranulum sp.]|nr:hypothetical protein [Subdoligranulum sp.]
MALKPMVLGGAGHQKGKNALKFMFLQKKRVAKPYWIYYNNSVCGKTAKTAAFSAAPQQGEKITKVADPGQG